jgi:hypothetical protein
MKSYEEAITRFVNNMWDSYKGDPPLYKGADPKYAGTNGQMDLISFIFDVPVTKVREDADAVSKKLCYDWENHPVKTGAWYMAKVFNRKPAGQ